MGKKKWTDKEIEFIQQNYNSMGNIELGKILDRTATSVSAKIRKILPRVLCFKNSGEINRCRNWKGYGDLGGTKFSHIIAGAKSRNIEFDLTVKDIYSLYEKQNKKCIYTGLDLVFADWYNDKKRHNNSIGIASVDRIDSNLSYHINNIQIVHKDINFIKSTNTESEFFDWIRLIVNPEKGHISDDVIVKYHNKHFQGVGNLYRHQWTRVVHKAKNRKIDIFINMNQIWDLFVRQNGCCIYTGLPLYMPIVGNKYSGTASLDRIDSSKDYTLDNIQWIHKSLNSMKLAFSDSYFREMCKLVYDYRGL